MSDFIEDGEDKYPWSEVCRAYDIVKSYNQEEYAFLDVEAERNCYKAALEEIDAYIKWKQAFANPDWILEIIKGALNANES